MRGDVCTRRHDRRSVRTGSGASRFFRPTQIWPILALAGALVLASQGSAAEGPFFITYTHQMEEPGNLEFTTKNVVGKPDGGSRFLGTAAEFEYGVKGWWTTEMYFDGQATRAQSALFTGYRWENRFRLLTHEHWINPVLCGVPDGPRGAVRLPISGNDHNADSRRL